MKHSWLGLGLILMMLMSVQPAAATEVKAVLDRNPVHLGDSVTLTVTIKGALSTEEPDFSVLVPDFVLQGTSRNQSINITNGQVDKTILFAVGLQPRRIGTLVIPALKVGSSKTDPLTLTVLPAGTQSQGSPGDDVFIRVGIEPKQVYVGQQTVLDVQLFYDGANLQGQLDDPAVGNAELQNLGKQIQYQSQRGDRLYRVVERRYSLIPQQAGSLDIAPIRFQGRMIDRNGAYGGFFGSGRSVQARSSGITLAVKPEPAAAAGSDWLPARSITLTMQGLPADGKATVGIPITVTLSEQAQGLPSDALPELSLPDVAGAEIYPDKTEASTDNDGQWLQGKRVRKFAIVPTRSGELHIPAIAVGWWNVQSDRAATASTKAHVLQVAAAAKSASAADGSDNQSALPPAQDKTDDSAASSLPAVTVWNKSEPLWKWLSAAALCLWLLTILAWWLWSRPRRSAGVIHKSGEDHAATSRASAKRSFMMAPDVRGQANALLHWARIERPGTGNLGQLEALLADEQQREMIARLQHTLYADNGAVLEAEEVRQVFKPGLAWRKADQQQASKTGLPPLYP